MSYYVHIRVLHDNLCTDFISLLNFLYMHSSPSGRSFGIVLVSSLNLFFFTILKIEITLISSEELSDIILKCLLITTDHVRSFAYPLNFGRYFIRIVFFIMPLRSYLSLSYRLLGFYFHEPILVIYSSFTSVA